MTEKMPEATEDERRRFFELANRLIESTDRAKQESIKKILAQRTFER